MAKYKSFKDNYEKIKKQVQKQETSGFFDERMWSPKLEGTESKFVVRILPNDKGSGIPWVVRQEHNINSGSSFFTDKCLRSAPGEEKCPICEKATKMYNGDNALDQDKAKKMFSKKFWYMNVLIVEDGRDEGANVGKIKLWKASYKLQEKLKSEFNEDEHIFWDYFEGRNFRIHLSKQGDYVNYDKSKFLDPTPLVKVKDGKKDISEKDVDNAIDKIMGECYDLQAEILEAKHFKTPTDIQENFDKFGFLKSALATAKDEADSQGVTDSTAEPKTEKKEETKKTKEETNEESDDIPFDTDLDIDVEDFDFEEVS